MAQQETDKKTPDPAVTVQKRVNGLELGMSQRDLYQEWELRLTVKKPLELPESWCAGCGMSDLSYAVPFATAVVK